MCSTSPEMIFSSCESLRSRNLYLSSSRSFDLIDYIKSKGIAHISNRDVRRMVVSSHLAPGPLEGFFPGKMRLDGTNQQLQFVRTLLIDNYDSYTYNIFQELSIVNGCKSLFSFLSLSTPESGKNGFILCLPIVWRTTFWSLLHDHIVVIWVATLIG